MEYFIAESPVISPTTHTFPAQCMLTLIELLRDMYIKQWCFSQR